MIAPDPRVLVHGRQKPYRWLVTFRVDLHGVIKGLHAQQQILEGVIAELESLALPNKNLGRKGKTKRQNQPRKSRVKRG